MANRFEVQVVALYKFTKVFRNLNNRAGQAVRPLTNVQRQVGALSRELHLEKIAKGMGTVSRVSLTMARSLGAATAPMEALFGLGAAGGIAAVAAGIVTLGARWGRLGYEVNRTAQTIGVSTDDLQRYRGAAGLAGVSSDALTGSLHSLGDTLQDALYGRNPQALVILNKLGIGIKRNKDGVIDSAAAFMDLSRAISRISDPRVQQLIARAFGVEEALPLLRQGPEAIERNAKAAEQLGLVMGGPALDGAQRFGDALNKLKATGEGLANVWGAKVTPALTRGMNALDQGLSTRGIGGAVWDVLSGKLTRDMVFGGPSASASRRRQSGLVVYPEEAGQPNNPGNLRAWRGVPTVNGFAQFPSPTAGLNAMAQQIGLYSNRDGLNTIGGIVGKYAPPSENNTAAYIADVARQTGFKPDQALDLNDSKVMAPLLSAMVKHEQGKQPFTPDQYQAAAQNVTVTVDFKNAPPGTTAQAKSGNTFLPTRVGYSMPMTDTP